MSDVEADTDESAPNLTKTSAFALFVTTTVSPPPIRRPLDGDVVADSVTDPVALKGFVVPVAIGYPRARLAYPMCSTITARLKAAFVAVGTVVGLVVVSDGAQNPPIQYQDCAMICCSRSIASRVTIATPSTIEMIESAGATSSAAIPAKSPSISAPRPQMIGRRTIRPVSMGCGCT